MGGYHEPGRVSGINSRLLHIAQAEPLWPVSCDFDIIKQWTFELQTSKVFRKNLNMIYCRHYHRIELG